MSLLGPQLTTFMAVAKTKTVHEAAQRVNLTQTAVTQRIKALESRLRSTLFIRSHRGMKLTVEGEALVRYCLAACELEGEALAIIQGSGIRKNVKLTISAPSSIMQARIAPSCAALLDSFPHLFFHFDVDDIEQRHQKLNAGLTDFAIIQKEHVSPEMKYKKLLPEKYLLVCTPEWKGRSLKKIIKEERIIDFNPTDDVTINYLKHYNLYDMAQSNRYFVNRTEIVTFLASKGFGYSTITEEFARPYVEENKLIVLNDGKSYDYQPCLVWFDRPEPPKYFSAVIKAIN